MHLKRTQLGQYVWHCAMRSSLVASPWRSGVWIISNQSPIDFMQQQWVPFCLCLLVTFTHGLCQGNVPSESLRCVWYVFLVELNQTFISWVATCQVLVFMFQTCFILWQCKLSSKAIDWKSQEMALGKCRKQIALMSGKKLDSLLVKMT